MWSHKIKLSSPSLWRNCMVWWHPWHLFCLKYKFLVPNVRVISLHRTLSNIYIQLWTCFISMYKVSFSLVLNKDPFLNFSFMLFSNFAAVASHSIWKNLSKFSKIVHAALTMVGWGNRLNHTQILWCSSHFLFHASQFNY